MFARTGALRARAEWLRSARRGVGVSRAAASSSRGGTTILGSTAGVMLAMVSGTVLAWPLGDLYFGPMLVKYAADAPFPPRRGDEDASAAATTRAVREVLEEQRQSGTARIRAQSGGVGRALAVAARDDEQRSVVYISLREAASAHDLLFCLVAGVYASERLGLVGTLAQSMGVWWIVLFDIIVGNDPSHTRSVHFSIVLQHVRRGLACARSPASSPRPLLVIDNAGSSLLRLATSAHHETDLDALATRAMLRKLGAWCGTLALDDDVDVVVCAGPYVAPRRRFARECEIGREYPTTAEFNASLCRWLHR